MKIGIIIYSQTGNTESVALKLKDKLEELKHSVTLEKVEVSDVKYGNFELVSIPKVDKYDVIIFGSPVQAFSLAKMMNSYLDQITSLRKKKIMLFVTEHFPYPWMGGSRAIKQMRKFCEEKEGEIIGTGVINWSNKKKEQMITNLIDKFSKLV